MLGKGRDAPSFGFDLHRPALPLHFSFAYSTPVKSVLCRRGGVLFLRTGVRGLFAPFSASCETSNGRAADLRFYFEKTPAAAAVFCPNVARCAAGSAAKRFSGRFRIKQRALR
ncbi:MAG: hypothetical protein HP049_05620, partial [Clostridiales bacterium]|nr:hypothetical protein [Clostridiales bacterium]